MTCLQKHTQTENISSSYLAIADVRIMDAVSEENALEFGNLHTKKMKYKHMLFVTPTATSMKAILYYSTVLLAVQVPRGIT